MTCICIFVELSISSGVVDIGLRFRVAVITNVSCRVVNIGLSYRVDKS